MERPLANFHLLTRLNAEVSRRGRWPGSFLVIIAVQTGRTEVYRAPRPERENGGSLGFLFSARGRILYSTTVRLSCLFLEKSQVGA